MQKLEASCQDNQLALLELVRLQWVELILELRERVLVVTLARHLRSSSAMINKRVEQVLAVPWLLVWKMLKGHLVMMLRHQRISWIKANQSKTRAPSQIRVVSQARSRPDSSLSLPRCKDSGKKPKKRPNKLQTKLISQKMSQWKVIPKRVEPVLEAQWLLAWKMPRDHLAMLTQPPRLTCHRMQRNRTRVPSLTRVVSQVNSRTESSHQRTHLTIRKEVMRDSTLTDKTKRISRSWWRRWGQTLIHLTLN